MTDGGGIDEDRSTEPAGPSGRSVYDRGDAVCVIGAGSSGLAAVKNLREHGFEVDCYERETGVGGGWDVGADRSPMYLGLHMVSSRPFTQFPDFPMPDAYPDYPDHRRVLDYLERYADHFGLREHVWFGTEVVDVAATDGHRWEVTVRGTGGGPSRTLAYAAVVVANGHLWHPYRPEYPGQETFTGEIIHSAGYSDPAQLRGKRVLVIGGGNSGCDIAVAAAQQAGTAWHSTRHGEWLTPKYLLGRPADQLDDLTRALRLPLWARRLGYRTLLRLTAGRPARFGLAKPTHRPFTAHPVVTSQLLYHLGHGDVTPKPGIAEFTTNRVLFTDGTEADPQLVVFATGYRPRFDFLAPEHLGGDEQKPRLYLQLLNPKRPTLSVAGLIDPDSGQFGLVHWQTVLIARLLRTRIEAPARADALLRRAERDLDRRYLQTRMAATARHRFDVGHHRYLAALGQALTSLERTT
ncbi:flavin-binding monooxygenase [Actinocatenispora thailandica]|uniref:Flavin-binding monooxygenase n=1 Tax=Actinocatenispora thailandica TaxID=227318 RepID=A0A7R7DRU3_9ACTN|nr:NAD(P)-binding domain-containing protein [Actinocatenispora thailandica]BCJ36659.1 flavin-binding monooxygenase [Actinocatenispora thailandica]